MLTVEDRWQLPIPEASALALRNGDLLAVDDEAFAVVVAPRLVPPARATEVGGPRDRRKSDFEGVASDASGRVFIVQEGADRILVYDESLRELRGTITLSVPPDQPDFGREWHADDNARAEGLLLLRDGHLLVAKQKERPWLIEFGPAGPAHGFVRGDALTPAESFSLGDGDVVFEVLAWWGLADSSGLASLNDLAVDDTGTLYAVSSASRRLGRLEGRLHPRGGTVALTAWDLPTELFETDDDKAEGVVFAPGLGWLVALDRGRVAPNLFRIGGLEG